MKNYIRSDLALELNEDIKDNSVDNGIEVFNNCFSEGKLKETTIKIINEKGESLIGKSIGTYITIEGASLNEFDEDINKEFSNILNFNLKALIGDASKILVIGLGNRQICNKSRSFSSNRHRK